MVLYVRKRELDVKIMQYIEKNPRATISELAKNLGIERELARYYVEALIREGKLLGTIEPEKPYMRFKVEKIEVIGDNIRVADDTGFNIFETKKDNPVIEKIKKGVILEVYEDGAKVVE
jgi:DNA-binding Lrp family transcriptional regulator